MKKMTRLVSVFLVVVVLALALASCAPSVEDVVGTYSGSYVYNGNSYYVIITLNEDGNYLYVSSKNGQIDETKYDEYEIKGNKIRLYDSELSKYEYHGAYIEYKYSKGTLTNNGHKFTKGS